jgi:hypothetical protein
LFIYCLIVRSLKVVELEADLSSRRDSMVWLIWQIKLTLALLPGRRCESNEIVSKFGF